MLDFLKSLEEKSKPKKSSRQKTAEEKAGEEKVAREYRIQNQNQELPDFRKREKERDQRGKSVKLMMIIIKWHMNTLITQRKLSLCCDIQYSKSGMKHQHLHLVHHLNKGLPPHQCLI
ncbi:uncharacterized protein LOC109820401 [Asparagus officinalis]|uniref:uncharacterized protein LOC109820401 n=1 Tax=Asparagus officinalis TaxID=4686 RepID=UPI00098E36F6|nr:uncharacterized protein LOC109820401 [Asparagus officinalis]